MLRRMVVRLKTPQAWALMLLLPAAACTPAAEKAAPVSMASAAPAATATPVPEPSPVAPVEIPENQGAVGSVVADGRTSQIRHVYARTVEEDHPFRGRETLTVLLLSDRVLIPSTFGKDVWKYYGQSLEFEGMALRIAEDGTMRTLMLKRKVGSYQQSGTAKMDDFLRAGAVVSGRGAQHGVSGGLPGAMPSRSRPPSCLDRRRRGARDRPPRRLRMMGSGCKEESPFQGRELQTLAAGGDARLGERLPRRELDASAPRPPPRVPLADARRAGTSSVTARAPWRTGRARSRSIRPGEEHAVAIGASDVRCLNVELSAAWAGALGGSRPSVRPRGRRPAGLARARAAPRGARRPLPPWRSRAPCWRCSESSEASAAPASDRLPPRWLDDAEEILRAEYRTGSPPSTALAARVGVHPVHLSRTWRRFRRCSLGEAPRSPGCRGGPAAESRRASQALVDVALDLGFADQAHFTRLFSRVTGISAARVRPEGTPALVSSAQPAVAASFSKCSRVAGTSAVRAPDRERLEALARRATRRVHFMIGTRDGDGKPSSGSA